MSDDTSIDDASDDAPAPDPVVPKSKFAGVVKQRDELKAKLREYEDRERQKADEDARKAQDWEKLEKSFRKDLEGLAKANEDLQNQIVARDRAERENKFVDAVMAKAGLPAAARKAVRGLMREDGIEISDDDDIATKAAVYEKQLRKDAAYLFKTSAMGPNGTPGGDSNTDEDPRLASVRAAAKALGYPGGIVRK